jgi:hypothetical protein
LKECIPRSTAAPYRSQIRQALASGRSEELERLAIEMYARGRLFDEERRRTKIILHAFDERAVLKPMYAALIRASQLGVVS